jgi:hypothetical protein
MKEDNAKAWMFGVVSRGITTICTKDELLNFFGDVRSKGFVYPKDSLEIQHSKKQKMHDMTLEGVRLAVFKYAEALESDVFQKPIYMSETKEKRIALGGYYNTVTDLKPVLPTLMTMKEFVDVMHEVYKRLPDPSYEFPNTVPATAAELRLMMAPVMEKMENYCKTWHVNTAAAAAAAAPSACTCGAKRSRE